MKTEKLNGNFEFIDSQEKLEKAYSEWTQQDLIAVDLECENNLHHYGLKMALIQVSTRKKHYIVDPIVVEDLSLVKKMLEDGSIRKIFHDVNFDFEVLSYALKCKPENVFDTQMAAILSGKKEIGLASLLEEFFHVKKEKKFQKADWSKRPLRKDMLSYAINDTTYLIRLYSILRKELEKLGRLSWMEDEMEHVEKKEFKHKKSTFLDLKGLRDLSSKHLAILRRLFNLRERFAKKVDRPVHFVISSKRLVELAKNPPKLEGWRRMKGVHPIVKKNAELFNQSVVKGKSEKVKLPTKKGKRFTERQKRHMNDLLLLRKHVAEKIDLAPHLVMDKDQMQDIVISGTNRSLLKWQRDVLKSS